MSEEAGHNFVLYYRLYAVFVLLGEHMEERVKNKKSARPTGNVMYVPETKPERNNESKPVIKAKSERKPEATEKRKTKPGTRQEKKKIPVVQIMFLAEAFLIILALIILFVLKTHGTDAVSADSDEIAVSADGDVVGMAQTEELSELDFSPHCTEQTTPSSLIEYTEININGNTLNDISEYRSADVLSFGIGNDYSKLEGIATFRGNNFRDDPTYGYAEMKDFQLKQEWSHQTGSLTYGDACWTGSGWTGQPLMAKWPKDTKVAMNMYDWAKQDEELVEVIYACMDGYIYFLDLETGKPTRDAFYLGYTCKGSGALDPRGYPIMYVGAGYDSYEGTARAFVINLIDCSEMYTFGDNDEFSLRGSLSYFDSSALVDAETDTLIYPGENGILYLVKLNTSYDEASGTLSIAPTVVKWHYSGIRSSLDSYWLGMEDSAAVYGGYLFIADNGGNLMCIDLNTLQLVWVQDVLDDSNSTPVLSVEDGHLYLYVSTSFRLGWRSYDTAEVPIWKIDAETGEIVWKTPYECYTEDGVSGGVQSTIATGREELSDYIYVTVARTGESYDGVLACINKKTGNVEWEHKAYYAWSSPVCVYNSDGSGKVLYCSCAGKMYLLDGKTGEVCDILQLSDGAIEASPAVYNNYAVVGTRDCEICGIKLQ